MKTFFVVNPQSAAGQTGRRWADLHAQILRALPGAAHAFTAAPMDAARLTTKALRDGYGCVVAVGGDGTVNEVVNGFFEKGSPVAPGAALGVLPRGTGGDFRKTFGWENDVASNLARLAKGATRPLDVGLLDYTTHDGAQAQRYFANVCGFGASGAVDDEANRASKVLGGKVAFMAATVRALLKYSDKKVRVSFDGGPLEAMTVTSLSAGNGRYFGGGMKVCPDADPSDGLLDVTIWSGLGLANLASAGLKLYDGTHVKLKQTRTLRCRELRAESDEQVLIDCDGEQPGRLPCAIRILPGALRLLD